MKRVLDAYICCSLGTLTMLKSSDFQKAVELIDNSNSILITTHTRPDGDACGSVVAVADTLNALGKKTVPLLLSAIPTWYEFLFAEAPKILGPNVNVEQLKQARLGQFDLFIIIDTNSYSQLPKFDDYLKQNDKPVLVIDHHVTSDNLGSVEIIDTTAAAAGLLIFDLLNYADWPITPKIAEALFVAVATDTGWFQFNNTDSRVHQTCANLIDLGANPTKIYRNLYLNFSHQRFKLMAAMLNTLELHFDDRYAAQHLRRQDFDKTGATHEDTENLINECQRISTIKAAALFVELADGRIKCSLRSQGDIDVRKIAEKFGGGGHANAAGAHLPGPLEHAKLLIKTEVERNFQ